MDNYFFDFDGTLANSGQTAVLATQKAFRDLELEVPNSKKIAYYMGIPIEVSFKKLAAPHTFDSNEFNKLLATFRHAYQQLEEKNLQLFDGIQDMLKSLKEQNKKLFVISSKHSLALKRNLKSLGIYDYFDNIIGSDQVKNYKPAPDGILELLNRNKLSAKDSIMIGDAIFDIQMGKSASVHTCGVTWGTHDIETLKSEKPEFLVYQPSDILSI